MNTGTWAWGEWKITLAIGTTALVRVRLLGRHGGCRWWMVLKFNVTIWLMQRAVLWTLDGGVRLECGLSVLMSSVYPASKQVCMWLWLLLQVIAAGTSNSTSDLAYRKRNMQLNDAGIRRFKFKVRWLVGVVYQVTDMGMLLWRQVGNSGWWLAGMSRILPHLGTSWTRWLSSSTFHRLVSYGRKLD
jgi:hypothetical protein